MATFNRNTITNMRPAAWHGEMWREAFHCGNGEIGASVYGNVADETIFVSHAELYHWGNSPELPDISGSLAETRRLMDGSKWMEANWVSANMLKAAGYDGRVFKPCPLCDVKIHTETIAPFANYYRTLDMETAEITVAWNEGSESFKRKTFVSRTHDMLCMKFEGTRDITAKIFLQLHDTGRDDTKRKREEVGDTLQNYVDGDYIFYAATNDDGTDFGAVAKVVHGGISKVEKDSVFCVDKSPDVTVFVKFFVKGERAEAFAKLKNELAGLDGNYDFYLNAHAKAHGEIFNSCEIKLSGDHRSPLHDASHETRSGDHRSPLHDASHEIRRGDLWSPDSSLYTEELLMDIYKNGLASNPHAPALVEKLWRFGRYLLICGTRNLPFPLYGLWGGGYNLMWSHNMANENLQMMYWHTLTGGLEYAFKPVIDYYHGFIDTFKDNARKLFGLDGIYVPAGTSPGMGGPNQIVPVIMNWTGAVGWLSQHFYNYYLFTRDDEMLTEKILPFMEQALLFYENFVTLDTNGKVKIYPSVSPENTPINFYTSPECYAIGHLCPTTINATMDIAVLKELLTNMLDIASTKGMYAEKVPKWQDMLARIPAYEVNEDGAVKEWMGDFFKDRYDHRHISHIYPLFPGAEYVSGVSDPDMVQAFERAVDLRILGAQTGWSFSHMASIYARFGRAEKVMECLDNLSRACLVDNLTTLHNDWRRMGLSMNLGDGKQAPTQLDANMGIVNAVQEMLLFVSKDTVKILPALPKDFAKGSVRGLRFPYGSVSFEWDTAADMLQVEIIADCDCEINLILPGADVIALRLEKGEIYKL